MGWKQQIVIWSVGLKPKYSHLESTHNSVPNHLQRSCQRSRNFIRDLSKDDVPPIFGGLRFWNPLALSGKYPLNHCSTGPDKYGSVNPRSFKLSKFAKIHRRVFVGPRVLYNTSVKVRCFLACFLSSAIAIDVFLDECFACAGSQFLFRCALVVQDRLKIQKLNDFQLFKKDDFQLFNGWTKSCEPAGDGETKGQFTGYIADMQKIGEIICR